MHFIIVYILSSARRLGYQGYIYGDIMYRFLSFLANAVIVGRHHDYTKILTARRCM